MVCTVLLILPLSWAQSIHSLPLSLSSLTTFHLPSLLPALQWTDLFQLVFWQLLSCKGRLQPSYWCFSQESCCKALYGAFETVCTSGACVPQVSPLVGIGCLQDHQNVESEVLIHLFWFCEVTYQDYIVEC